MPGPSSNRAVSVKARLLNLAKARGEELEQVLVRYGVERLLHRLSVSEHRDQFILKGAMLFVVWEGAPHRVTRDVDLLGLGDDSLERVAAVFRELCGLTVEDDGLRFQPESVETEAIRALEEYGGVRTTLQATLGSARIRVQADVGFGDAVTPRAEEIEFPTLLGGPKPRRRAYPAETAIAEKILTIIENGLVNSRMKDYFDLLYLSRARGFDGPLLVRALRATAQRRGLVIPIDRPIGLTPAFGADATKQRQWAAFIRRTRLATEWTRLEDVVREIDGFLGPVVAAASGGGSQPGVWSAGDAWREAPRDEKA